MSASKRIGMSGVSVFDRGFLSIYSRDKKSAANTVVLVAGVVSVGIVGYTFWRGAKR